VIGKVKELYNWLKVVGFDAKEGEVAFVLDRRIKEPVQGLFADQDKLFVWYQFHKTFISLSLTKRTNKLVFVPGKPFLLSLIIVIKPRVFQWPVL
jgi:hypothetical protein